MNKRLKVLVSAYACSPRQGSEPSVGWGFVEALSHYHDLWVITEKHKFEAEIEAELQRRPALRKTLRFHYVPRARHETLRKLWPPSYYWFYKAWQKKAFAIAARLHDDIGFDVVHQLNMVGFREPGYLWKLDAPFVWGPIGGLGLTPWRFLPAMGPYGALYYGGRNLVNLFHMHLLRRPRQAAARAQGNMIAATSDMRAEAARLWEQESRVICEIGVAGPQRESWVPRRGNEELRLAWSGQHTPGKALNLLLHALVLLPENVRWRLEILGEGRQTAMWKKLSGKLNLAHACHFHGWLPKEDAVFIVGNAHLLIISSLKDLTSSVLLEALSHGVPVICLDHCGFSDVVTEGCGIKIPVSNPRQVIRDFAAAIERVWLDEPYRARLAWGAARRAAEYSWEKKAEAVNAVYERAILTYRDWPSLGHAASAAMPVSASARGESSPHVRANYGENTVPGTGVHTYPRADSGNPPRRNSDIPIG